MSDRDEIERVKEVMRRERRQAHVAKLVRDYLGSPEDRAIAAAELDAEGAGEPVAPVDTRILGGKSRADLLAARDAAVAKYGSGSKKNTALILGCGVTLLRMRWHEVAHGERWPTFPVAPPVAPPVETDGRPLPH